MMQHQHSDDGRKSMIGKRQFCSVALNHCHSRIFVALSKSGGVRRIIFEAGHAASAAQQRICSRAWPSADFQYVIAERVPRQYPREKLTFGNKSPNGGTAKPIFKFIHGGPVWRG